MYLCCKLLGAIVFVGAPKDYLKPLMGDIAGYTQGGALARLPSLHGDLISQWVEYRMIETDHPLFGCAHIVLPTWRDMVHDILQLKTRIKESSIMVIRSHSLFPI